MRSCNPLHLQKISRSPPNEADAFNPQNPAQSQTLSEQEHPKRTWDLSAHAWLVFDDGGVSMALCTLHALTLRWSFVNEIPERHTRRLRCTTLLGSGRSTLHFAYRSTDDLLALLFSCGGGRGPGKSCLKWLHIVVLFVSELNSSRIVASLPAGRSDFFFEVDSAPVLGWFWPLKPLLTFRSYNERLWRTEAYIPFIKMLDILENQKEW